MWLHLVSSKLIPTYILLSLVCAGDSRLVCARCRTFVAPDSVRKCHWCELQLCAAHVWEGVVTTSDVRHDMCDRCIDEVGEGRG